VLRRAAQVACQTGPVARFSGLLTKQRDAIVILETPDGRFFSLRIDGYQFPDEELGPTEDNPASDFEAGRFLFVRCDFRNADGDWSSSGPIMTTTELERFTQWLDSIRNNSVALKGVYFTERDLEFSLDDTHTNLLVHTSNGFLPKWHVGSSPLTIAFPLDCVNLDDVIESLKAQLKIFPGRPPVR
jgi:hypothetical protein